MAAEPKSTETKQIKSRAKAKAEPEIETPESDASELPLVQLKPVEAKPVEAKPLEIKPAESKPIELKLTEVKAADVKIPEVKPKPANKRPNAYPTEGFALEIDGKVKSEYLDIESVRERGLALKAKYPVLRVVVYDAATKSRTVLEVPA